MNLPQVRYIGDSVKERSCSVDDREACKTGQEQPRHLAFCRSQLEPLGASQMGRQGFIAKPHHAPVKVELLLHVPAGNAVQTFLFAHGRA